MIDIKIKGEVPLPPEPERTVEFEFRRHEMSRHNKSDAQKVYLVAESGPRKKYVLHINGATKTVEIRRADFEELGFSVLVI